MGDWKRYAIYYTATGALAEFGADWLGWELASGQPRDHPHFPGVSSDWIAGITSAPRRYGFHATLKPPFAIVRDSSKADLRASLAALAKDQAPVPIPGGLRLAILDGFPALICADHAPLTDLAARLVRDLDPHRAPLTDADRARRNPDQLSSRQRDNLDRWGYPWVMEEFRFHMTLGNRLRDADAEQVLELLGIRLAPLLTDPHIIDSVTLVGEDKRGRFHKIERFPLTT